jgi:D-methionine transport system permease protein
MNETLDLSLKLIPIELWNTVYMVFVSGFFALLFGIPLGVLLAVSDQGGIRENRPLYIFLGAVVNVGRSIPFAILMIALIPFTRMIIGTSIGTTASIVPLTLAACPFVARLIETSLKEIKKELIEAAQVMHATPFQIVTKVLLPEAYPSIVAASTLMIVNLIGYSAMAGLVGGGGLGRVAIQYGYQRFNGALMLETLIILLLLVELVQWIGNEIVRRAQRKRGVIR